MLIIIINYGNDVDVVFCPHAGSLKTWKTWQIRRIRWGVFHAGRRAIPVAWNLCRAPGHPVVVFWRFCGLPCSGICPRTQSRTFHLWCEMAPCSISFTAHLAFTQMVQVEVGSIKPRDDELSGCLEWGGHHCGLVRPCLVCQRFCCLDCDALG